jgi:cytochrome c biogenesis protein CcmG/thiol:disulfide interchange protein DsbE
MGALRMRKFANVFLFLVMLTIVVIDFSGCGSSGLFKASAQENGKSSKKDLQDAPDVTFKDLQGKDVRLADLKGKVVVINFWATWCEPCQIEIPWMIGFQEKYADKGFTLLGVAMDDEGKSVVGPYVEKTQFDVDGKKMVMNYPIVIGSDDLSSKFGGLIGLPTTVVLGRDGKVHKRFLGLVSHDELEKEIKELL